MNSLLNYGSDDDYDDSSEEKQTDWRGLGSKDKQCSSGRQTDANYEEVQMDLSEESNDSKPEHRKEVVRVPRERDTKDRREEDRRRPDREDHRRRSRDADSKSRVDHDSKSRDYNHRRERDRKSRRSSSRERRRSRSPRKSERESKPSSRSKSRDRDRNRKYSKKYDREGIRIQADKTDSEKSAVEEKRNSTSNDSDRFFMPGISGRFRDQIERRKLLWQKKDTAQDNKNNGQSKKVWETTTFAQDTDGKVANKFKRLMGIKGNTQAGGQGGDVLKKQEEMFSSMEQQYEVARTATHTMRGVGFGFSSYQR